jgi:hypothetical protein
MTHWEQTKANHGRFRNADKRRFYEHPIHVNYGGPFQAFTKGKGAKKKRMDINFFSKKDDRGGSQQRDPYHAQESEWHAAQARKSVSVKAQEKKWKNKYGTDMVNPYPTKAKTKSKTTPASAKGKNPYPTVSKLASAPPLKIGAITLGSEKHGATHHSSAPFATSSVTGPQKETTVRITRTELFGVRVGDKSEATFTIMPVNSAASKWGNHMAKLFTNVKYHGVTFHWQSRCSVETNATVIIAWSPYPLEARPNSIEDASQYQWRVMGNAWTNMSLHIPGSVLAESTIAKFTEGGDPFMTSFGTLILGVGSKLGNG